jgi:hypothetical protein
VPIIREKSVDGAAYRLAQEIITLSVADTWDAARQEWKLAEVQFADPDAPERCLCGHYPILELCILSNWQNGATAVVGNTCVTKFMGIPSGPIFTGLERIKNDPDAALNVAAVEYAYGKGWLNSWERKFTLDTARRKRMSPYQWDKRAEINAKVIASMNATSVEAYHA